MTELTAHRTLGLRHALGEQPDVAFLAALHALTLKVFYHYGSDSCLELDLKSASFGAQAPGLNDSASAEAIRVRHESWAKALPKESGRSLGRAAGVGLRQPAGAVRPYRQPLGQRRARSLEPAAAGARPCRSARAGGRPRHGRRRLDAHRRQLSRPSDQGPHPRRRWLEAKGQRAADRIEHLKKGDMAAEAETLLADTGWLPEPLRTPDASRWRRADVGSATRAKRPRRQSERRNCHGRRRWPSSTRE